MSINSLQSVGVAHHNHFAVATRLIIYHTHLSVEGRTNGIALVCIDIKALMLAAETLAIAIIGSHYT